MYILDSFGRDVMLALYSTTHLHIYNFTRDLLSVGNETIVLSSYMQTMHVYVHCISTAHMCAVSSQCF